jgi:aryl-alcohol dehydrogenase-like predicted oxidoreductase
VEGDDIDRPAAEHDGLTPDGLRRGVEANLRTLGVDRMDVVNLRMGDRGHDGSAFEPALETLMSLRAEGLLRHIGISNVTRAEFDRARGIAEIVCVQNLYNIADRDDDPLIDACAAADIAYVPFFPVGGGFRPLAAERLNAVAERVDATVQQVALAWLLARSPNIAVIPGTGSVAHLEENIAAAQLRLTEKDLAELG